MNTESLLRLIQSELLRAWMQCADAANRELLMELANATRRVADQLAEVETV